MRASTERRAGRRHSNMVACVCLLFAALAFGPAGAIATADDRIGVRVYDVQASGLSTYDCSVQVEVHNETEEMLARTMKASMMSSAARAAVLPTSRT